jgi:hypothetical protein
MKSGTRSLFIRTELMTLTPRNSRYSAIRPRSQKISRSSSRNERDPRIPPHHSTATGRSRYMSRAFSKLSAASICQPQQIHQLLETRVLGN